MAVLREGQGTSRRAVTHIRVLERFSSYTYVECVLETGRTHQIRVHTAYIGHPVLGDEVYGPKRCPYRLEGQTLHAMVLGLRHPSTDEYMEFKGASSGILRQASQRAFHRFCTEICRRFNTALIQIFAPAADSDAINNS